MGVEVQLYSIFNLGISCGWVVKATPHCFTCGGKPCYPFYRKLGRSQGQCERARKISHPPPFKTRTVKPVTSGCTDYAIPAHHTAEQKLKFDEIINTSIIYTYLKTNRQDSRCLGRNMNRSRSAYHSNACSSSVLTGKFGRAHAPNSAGPSGRAV